MLEHGISSWQSWAMSDTGKIPPRGKASPWVCFSCLVWPAPPRNTARSLTADTHGSFLMFTCIGNRDNVGLITQMLLQNGMQVNQDPACHMKGSSLPSPLCNGCPNWTQPSMRQRRHFSTDWNREHVKWWLGKLEEATCFEEVAWNMVAVSNPFPRRSICCQQKCPPDSEADNDVWGAWRSYCKKRKGGEGERKARTNENI